MHEMPLYDALIKLKNEKQLGFHMPGHLGEKGMEGFGSLLDIDVTELPESGNLFFCGDDPISRAEAAAARFFGAKKTRFSVNGSSGGIMAAVGAVCREGEKIICDRFCHRSFISALILGGAVPVWIYPEIIGDGGLWGGINPADAERTINENPDAKAVYITSPNYFGLSCDVKRIAAAAHEAGLPLIVDAAHGAHYGISHALPPSAVSLGADIVIASAHKTLPAVTQAAYVHINAAFPRLEAMLKMHQTSSPSYILMASLDFARAKMQAEGDELWTRAAEMCAEIFPDQAAPVGKYSPHKDPCRLVLPLNSPFDGAERLRTEHKISVECTYGEGVVCIVNTAHTREDLLTLKRAADEVNALMPKKRSFRFAPVRGKTVVPPRTAFFAENELVPIKKAVGRVCAAEVLVYPPGVAQLMPGEVVDSRSVSQIMLVKSCGGEVHGIENEKILCVKE